MPKCSLDSIKQQNGVLSLTSVDSIDFTSDYRFSSYRHTNFSLVLFLFQLLPKQDDILRDIPGNYTLFVPSNSVLKAFLKQQSKSFWVKPENILDFIG